MLEAIKLYFTYELLVLWFPLSESGGELTLAVFGTIIYFRPATMAIDCGAEMSCSIVVLFGVVVCSLADFTLIGIDAIGLTKGIFFVGRFGVVSISDELGFLSSCSLLAAAAFCAASLFSRLHCYKCQQTKNFKLDWVCLNKKENAIA